MNIISVEIMKSPFNSFTSQHFEPNVGNLDGPSNSS